MFNKVKIKPKWLKILNISRLSVSRVFLYLAIVLLFLNIQTSFFHEYNQIEKLDLNHTIFQHFPLKMVFSNGKSAMSYS